VDFWDALARRTPTFLVGGAVRDVLSGAAPHDFDLALAWTPQEVSRWAAAAGLVVAPIGEAYGTVSVMLPTVGAVEVTTFRTEADYADRRHPAAVQFASDVHTDLARRDFTINAMALAIDGTLVDPYHGARDLAAGRVRAVGQPGRRFEEDPLRMWRAVRFSGLDRRGAPFRLARDTARSIRELAGLTATVSRERTGAELRRLLEAPHSASALRTASRLGLLDVLWPAWAATRGVKDGGGRTTLRAHLLATAAAGPTPTLRLAGLLHDIGQPETRPATRRRSGPDLHALVGARYTRDMLSGLGFERGLVDHVALLVEHHRFSWTEATERDLRRMLRRATPEVAEHLVVLRRMEVLARTGKPWPEEGSARERVRAATDTLALPVSGRDVMEWRGLGPGPLVGRLLAEVQAWVDEDPARNHPDQIRRFVEGWEAPPGPDSLDQP
jgi:tRNA nucleotidyltransferase (CCA-adding enzyme)